MRVHRNNVAGWGLRMIASEKFSAVGMASVRYQVGPYFAPRFFLLGGWSCSIHGVKHGWESTVRDRNCNRIKNLEQELTLAKSFPKYLWKYQGRF